WAISDGEAEWGVTALSAITEMDAGPVWGTRTFPLPATPLRKSALYAGLVTDAAVELALEVAEKAAQPDFVPGPPDLDRAPGRPRPTMSQADRAFSWSDPTAHVLRRIRAADGAPGVRAELAGLALSVFDAHDGDAQLPEAQRDGEPGSIVLRRNGAVLVRTGDGAVWIGHARPVPGSDTEPRVKLPAATLLGDRIAAVPEALDPVAGDTGGRREISYRRHGDVGVLTFDFYNGAVSTGQCHRLAGALRTAVAQDTRVLLLQGGEVFCNGIDLNVIEARRDPAAEAWRNIEAIDDVCREIITCTGQLVVAAVGGNAGAGGVTLALGADQVLLRAGVVLNPHYRTMGLFGSEYWTYVLPRRVGEHRAAQLTEECLPLGAMDAVEIGLADAVLPGDRAAFDAAVLTHAHALAEHEQLPLWLAAKARVRDDDEKRRPLETYRVRELAEMSHDIFDDRSGFAAARRAFVTKQRPVPASRTTAGAAPDRTRARVG
ncbi:MAG: putative two-component system protein hydrogenase maturation factor HypX/HoxX, partial [Pseudonocardiales bacterium]|nr:putative two-component system protein hydrogenase maturation factor HypX/HoxX [Pseudonocardiales bacterium]